jgi:hypothetical protein
MTKHGRWTLLLILVATVALGACIPVQEPVAAQPQNPTPVVQQQPQPIRFNTPPPQVVTPVSARNPELDTQAYRDRAQEAAAILNYNDPSNFGGGELTSGFEPDPWGFPLTAGGGSNPVDIATLGLLDDTTGEACGRAYVTRKPDFHFTFGAGDYTLVRFYVVTENGADATLLINDPSGRWRCNDDHENPDWGNERAPVIDFTSPETGRYDIWVGSYDQSAHNPATLFVTELFENHP